MGPQARSLAWAAARVVCAWAWATWARARDSAWFGTAAWAAAGAAWRAGWRGAIMGSVTARSTAAMWAAAWRRGSAKRWFSWASGAAMAGSVRDWMAAWRRLSMRSRT